MKQVKNDIGREEGLSGSCCIQTNVEYRLRYQEEQVEMIFPN